mgnify:CR=1 FL=1|tara:strand:- start:113 stop:694 length:582 start_codon:yes stop_codon:yes gene_type:complete
MKNQKDKEKKYNREIIKKEFNDFIGTLDPKKDIQLIATSAAEIIASEGLSTNWNDIFPMLDSQEISEELRLAANIIFRAKLILEEMEKNPSINITVYNTMLMMDSLKLASIKGYITSNPSTFFNKLSTKTFSIELAVKKERVINTIRELAKKNPNKSITWLRKKASELLRADGEKGYSYRQILRDTEGIKIKL